MGVVPKFAAIVSVNYFHIILSFFFNNRFFPSNHILGSFSCSFNSGYSLNEDGATCDDNDECLTGNCGDNSQCTNLPGSYSCQCNENYFDSSSQFRLKNFKI